MKKFFSVVILAAIIFVGQNFAQAQSDFDLNKNFSRQLVPTSNIFWGTVSVKTHLLVHERMSVNSAVVMRLSNGTKLTLRDTGTGGEWYEVVDVNGVPFNGIGYVSGKYLRNVRG